MGEFQQDVGTATGYLKRTLVMAPIMEHLSLCLKTLNDREQVKGRLQLQGRDRYNQAPIKAPSSRPWCGSRVCNMGT